MVIGSIRPADLVKGAGGKFSFNDIFNKQTQPSNEKPSIIQKAHQSQEERTISQ
jgi:hypothetical protein